MEGDVATGEQVAIHYDRMSSRDNQVSVQSNRSRQYAISMLHKLGAGKDFVKVTLNGVPAEAGKPAAMNLQPGARVIDLFTGTPTSLRVDLDGVVSGKTVKASFNTQLQGGQRLVFSDLADPGRLKIGTIDSLLGNARNFQIVNRQ